ncbi:MAG: AmmeMemoRadiSam system protein B [Desulfobacteraceae bacterium 4572_35.1]|nr:MAG: AmmeMemoRadiSam system protein B [Desulfobacteraceae bacterium 4572_35.1]
MQRHPTVSGQFYPDNPTQLQQDILHYMGSCSQAMPALGLMAPHAGYVYSGATAGKTFAVVEVPDRVILIGPNHHGIGSDCAVYSEGSWITPLGTVAVDNELADLIIDADSAMHADRLAHQYEHSLEVMLPFLQTRNPQVKIVPISLKALPFEKLAAMAHHLSAVIKGQDQPVLIVASSDMTHYAPAQVAQDQDLYALEAVLNLDGKQLYKRVQERQISMCGVCAVTLMLLTLVECRAKQAELVNYANSGEVSGDYRQVVGYAGVVIR